jgi:hypothetical protein
VTQLADPASLAAAERVLAWGKPMLIDASYSVAPAGAAPKLSDLRAKLIGGYPQVGPIFA